MPQIESLQEKAHLETQVDLVSAIIFGMEVKAHLLRRDVAKNEHPDPQVVDDLIERVRRLQIALEGCKVGMPERAGGL